MTLEATMTAPYWTSPDGQHVLYCGDALAVLQQVPEASVQCCITSPPYWGLRDYGTAGQLGLEATPEAYVANLVAVFREVRRILREDGTAWVNLGDSYAASGPAGGAGKQHTNVGSRDVPTRNAPPGLKPKDLVGIPWRVAFALQADGWYLRSEIIWHKPNPMPESVTDRPTKAHEQVFLLAKSQRYYYDAAAIAEASLSPAQDRLRVNGIGVEAQGKRIGSGDITSNCGVSETRNRRTVWPIPTHPFPGAHFATMPPALVQPCILAGCPPGGVVLDPFAGAATVNLVAIQEGRQSLSIELNPAYCAIAVRRLEAELAQPQLFAPTPPQPTQETLL